MRAVLRAALPLPVTKYLTQRTARLVAKGCTARDTEAAWAAARSTQKVRDAFAALVSMNGGARRCMYCEHDRGTDIDHFNPRANAPSLTFVWANWVLACGECNSRKKHSFPLGLLDPTASGYLPDAHLELLPSTGAFDLKSPQAIVSEPVYALNEGELQRSRKRVFALYQAGMIAFAEAKSSADLVSAAFFKHGVAQGPHPSVLATIQRWHGSPKRAELHPKCAAAIDAWPEILAW